MTTRIAAGAALAALVLAGCGATPVARGAPTAAPASAPTSAPAPSVGRAEPSPTPPVGRARSRPLGLQAVAALKRDDPARALALIAAGADVNVRDALQDSTFLYAGAEGYAEVVAAALRHGANTRVLNRYGGTALIPAAEHAHLEVIRILLRDSDVDVNHVNGQGWTALQEAIVLGHAGERQRTAVRLLLAAGADPGIRDARGRTALRNAERRGYAEIARLLRAASATPRS